MKTKTKWVLITIFMIFMGFVVPALAVWGTYKLGFNDFIGLGLLYLFGMVFFSYLGYAILNSICPVLVRGEFSNRNPWGA